MIKKYVLNNIRLKVLSIFLAILFWFAVSYTGDTKMTLTAPVNLSNLPAHQIIKQIDPDQVLLSISGPVSIIKNLRAKDIHIKLDLTDIKAGKNTLNLLKDNVLLPKGIKIENIKPDTINVETDVLVEKRLKVSVKLDKKWSGIYKIKSWSPQYLTVEGAKESLQAKDVIETKIVDGNFINDEEEVYVEVDTKGMFISKIKPDIVKVILKRL
ncbi:MAG TPA: CdaR family protein [Syntrophorhabdaceae bacterium]|nr:CdaR family protein [Syntrophorhabdaceae bacterium]